MNNSSLTVDMPGSSDPFAEVLESLKKSLTDVSAINPVLNDVTDIINMIDNVLKDINDIPEVLKGITGILETLDGLISLLDAVPIVGEIAATCEGVVSTATELVVDANDLFSTLDDEIISPCLPLINDVNKGLSEARTLVNTISETIPDYLNTIEILSYMTDIATPLVQVLEGTKSEDDLNALLKTFNTVKDDTAKVLKPISEFIAALDTGVNDIKGALGDSIQEIKSASEGVMQNLNSIEGVFDPVIHSFNKFADAIKPLKWVLDAAKWVFDKILKPVIDKIIKLTGIDKLLDPLEKEIKDKLGITPIQKALQGKIDSGSSSDWKADAGSDAASKGSANWGELVAVLSRYSTQNPNGIRNDVFLLVSAISATAIDPDKPAIIPNWPDSPGINGLSNATISLNASFIRAQRRAAIQSKLNSLGKVSLEMPSEKSFLALSPFIARNQPVMLDSTSSLVTLLALAQNEIAALSTVQSVSQLLVNNLHQFDEAKQLPSYYGAEISEFAQLFIDTCHVITFLAGFDVLKELLSDFEEPVNDMLLSLQNLTPSIETLLVTGNKMETLIAQLNSDFPSNRAFCDSVDFIDSVATGADVLASLEQELNVLNSKLNGDFTNRINVLTSQIDLSVASVTNQIQTLSANTQNALKEANIINSFLAEYAGLFGNLSKHVAIVSEQAMPKLAQGVSVLNTISSVLDPLTAIINEMKCGQDSDNGLKSEAAGILDTFKSTMYSGIQNKDVIIRDSFAFIINNLVPVDAIKSDASAISSYVASQDIGSTIDNMTGYLKSMNSEMVPKYSYTVKGNDGKDVTIQNVLLDQDFIQEARQLVIDMQDACVKANIPIE